MYGSLCFKAIGKLASWDSVLPQAKDRSYGQLSRRFHLAVSNNLLHDAEVKLLDAFRSARGMKGHTNALQLEFLEDEYELYRWQDWYWVWGLVPRETPQTWTGLCGGPLYFPPKAAHFFSLSKKRPFHTDWTNARGHLSLKDGKKKYITAAFADSLGLATPGTFKMEGLSMEQWMEKKERSWYQEQHDQNAQSDEQGRWQGSDASWWQGSDWWQSSDASWWQSSDWQNDEWQASDWHAGEWSNSGHCHA